LVQQLIAAVVVQLALDCILLDQHAICFRGEGDFVFLLWVHCHMPVVKLRNLK